MMIGPAVQDLWLLLPDHAAQCRGSSALLVEGYEAFLPFDRRELELVEGLRFMRMVYFLAWRSKQREDRWFRESFPIGATGLLGPPSSRTFAIRPSWCSAALRTEAAAGPRSID